MPIDTSMYGTAPKPSNPLDMLGGIAQITGAANQNKLFQQQFAAQKAIGQAYQQAIGPDGKIDTNKLMSIVANNPAAAFLSGDVAAQSQARQQAQLQIDTSQLDLANKHLAGMNDSISSLLANPNVTPKDVIGKIGDMIAEGRMTKEIAMQELSSMPQDGPGLRMWLTQHLVQNLDSQSKVQALYGQVQTVNTGGTTNVLAASPLTGVRPLAQMPNTMAPGEAASPVGSFDPVTQQPMAITKQQFANQAGGVQPGGPLPPVAGAPGASPGASPSARAAFDAAAAGAPPPPAGAPAAAPAPQGIPTGPALGASAAADVTGAQSASQGVELQKLADAVPVRKGILGNLETALNNFQSGSVADWKMSAKKFANSNSPFGDVFDPKSIASQEEFNKQATQLAQAQFQALGGTGTDAKLDSTMHTSPNEMLSKMGNKGIISMLKGNEDAIAAKNEAWQTYAAENGSQSYGKFSAAFNKSYDPRVFQWTYLDDAGKSDMLKSMSKSEKESYKNAFNLAVEKGWIADPRPPEMRTPRNGG